MAAETFYDLSADRQSQASSGALSVGAIRTFRKCRIILSDTRSVIGVRFVSTSSLTLVIITNGWASVLCLMALKSS